MNRTVPNPVPVPADAFQPMLKESIDRFLTEYRKGVTDFSNFTSIFCRFLQNSPDPPLEIIWFYAALTFHSTKPTAPGSSLTKDLFQLLVSCSTACTAASRKIAVLAPVIRQLCDGGKELVEGCEGLLEAVVGYLGICCGGCENDRVECLSACFVELVRVWTAGESGRESEFGEDLRAFFPMVGDGVRRRVVGKGCEVGCLAGIVMSEAFMLSLCLKFGAGFPQAELEEELKSRALQMMTAFRSIHFYDVLFKMLLEPVLPVSSLLTYKDEAFLREVLYDVMMEYSFLSPLKGIQIPGGRLKNLVMSWLFVADKAVRYSRKNGDQSKVISYVQAFSESCLPSQLIKLVASLPGMHGKTSTPNVSTPIALIKWLLVVEDEGVRVFDSDSSKIYAKSILYESRTEYEYFVVNIDGKNVDGNSFSYISNGSNGSNGDDKVCGHLEMVNSVSNLFMTDPGLMKLTENNCTRKRKEGVKDKTDKRVKFWCHLGDNSARDNPGFDEDMVDMEQ